MSRRPPHSLQDASLRADDRRHRCGNPSHPHFPRKELPHGQPCYLRRRPHRHRQNQNGCGPGKALRRRGGVCGLHADLPGHDHRHRRSHGGGNRGHPSPHGGSGRPGRELVCGPIHGAGRPLHPGYPLPGKAPCLSGRHGPLFGLHPLRPDLRRRAQRRRGAKGPPNGAGTGRHRASLPPITGH